MYQNRLAIPTWMAERISLWVEIKIRGAEERPGSWFQTRRFVGENRQQGSLHTNKGPPSFVP